MLQPPRPCDQGRAEHVPAADVAGDAVLVDLFASSHDSLVAYPSAASYGASHSLTHSLVHSLTHSLVRDDGSISAGLFATELVLNCPTERLEPVFWRLLPVLLEQVFHILHSNWRDMVLRDQAYASERANRHRTSLSLSLSLPPSG